MKRYIMYLLLIIILITGCSSNNIDIESFLTDGFVSESNVVGSGYPSGYIFNKDSTFAYYVGEADDLPSNSLVSCRGTWIIKDDTLILTVIESEYNEYPDDIWDNLIKKDDKYEIIYKDIKLINKNENKYLSTDKGNLYLLQIDKDYLELLSSLSKSYDDFYKAKIKYYESI